MTKYSVGFAFTADRQFVALIEKMRPKWQAGKLNGIGGHVEHDEPFAQAQQREFWEETGVVIPARDWKAYASLIGPDWHVRVFSAFTDDIYDLRSMTDETVKLLPVSCVAEMPIIANLTYLIPLALDDEHIGVPMFHYGKRKEVAAAVVEEISLEDVLGNAARTEETQKDLLAAASGLVGGAPGIHNW
jgi:8-oxo-dGTP diphosphatase